jgi:hypothetical protein
MYPYLCFSTLIVEIIKVDIKSLNFENEKYKYFEVLIKNKPRRNLQSSLS